MRIDLSLEDLAAGLPFDDIVDVRAPSEFAEDHIPGAINLPALSDAERAEVGTIYTRHDRFEARRIGAAYVARNVAHHLETALADRDGGWRPLVYCWRGGQRSGAVAAIFGQIGWRVGVVEGGYRSYRRAVAARLYDSDLPLRPVLLDGNTGTAKTRLLQLLAGAGWQVIDLEGLANHRGSVLGGRAGGQPSQKLFEGRIAAELVRIDPARPVVIEAESSKVGDCIVPPALWQAMRAAPRVELTAPVAARAAFLAREYGQDPDSAAGLAESLDLLRPIQGHAVVDGWQALLAGAQNEALARDLIERHYDPRYARARATRRGPRLHRLHLEQLDDATLRAALPRIGAALDAAAAEPVSAG
jgi:tRNA 2-selenouridine synthase